MIGEELLAIPPLGAYNLHGSLLPAYRGRCPVNWVLVNGEPRTGVTLHHMVKKADAGDMCRSRGWALIDHPRTRRCPFTGSSATPPGRLLDDVLPLMKSGTAPRIPQDISRGSLLRRPQAGRRQDRLAMAGPADLQPRARRDRPVSRGLLHHGRGGEAPGLAGSARKTGARGKRENPAPSGCGTTGCSSRQGRGSLKLLEVEAAGRRMTGDAIGRYLRDKGGMVLS